MRKVLLRGVAIGLALLLSFVTSVAVFIAQYPANELWYQVTLEFTNPHPGYTYFLVCRVPQEKRAWVERLRLPDGHTAYTKQKEGIGYWSTQVPLRLYAVPNDLSGKFTIRSDFDSVDTADWLDQPHFQSKLRWSRELEPQYTRTSATDPRQSITRRYRVEHTPTELKVELVEEKVTKSWRDILVVGGAGVVAFLVVAWFIVWLFWQANRR